MKKIVSIIPAAVSFLALPSLAFAQSIGSVCPSGSFGNLCLQSGNLGSVVGSITNLLFLVAGLIALIYLIIGGIKWVTSEGDSKNVEAARNQIIAAALGLAVTFLSYLIINLILTFLIGQGLSNLTLPQLGH
ncbi:MAG TPA: hypothetical protein VF820_00170 [Patescibacteria group bacterium]